MARWAAAFFGPWSKETAQRTLGPAHTIVATRLSAPRSTIAIFPEPKCDCKKILDKIEAKFSMQGAAGAIGKTCTPSMWPQFARASQDENSTLHSDAGAVRAMSIVQTGDRARPIRSSYASARERELPPVKGPFARENFSSA